MSKKIIKMKDLLIESNVWDRKFGEKLPTLDDVQKKYESKKMNQESADQKHKRAKKLVETLKNTVKELIELGEDYDAFMDAKKSAQLLNKIKKDVSNIS